MSSNSTKSTPSDAEKNVVRFKLYPDGRSPKSDATQSDEELEEHSLKLSELLRSNEEIETKPLQGNKGMLEVVTTKEHSRYKDFLKEGLRIIGVLACRTFNGNEDPSEELQKGTVSIAGIPLSLSMNRGRNGFETKDVEKKLAAFRENFNGETEV